MNSNLHTDKVAKFKCLKSTLFFTRYFFKHQQKRKFVVGEHHEIISSVLDKVISGDIKKLIINIAPRYGKTELAVKNFMAKGLAHNPKAKFIHLSYSDDLALDNSESVKDIVKSPEYQSLFDVKIKANSDSKKKWYTTDGGGVYATSAAGQVTGFGAGQVDDELEQELDNFTNSNKFGGALIIDDPIKPDDADSYIIRDRINNKFESTIRNRVNSRNTPIIIIMQRLHENDLCGFLIDKEPNEWTVVSLPCIKSDNTPLWEFKHTIEELEKMRKYNEVVFDRQYMQNPKPLKGMLFPDDRIKYYKPDKTLVFESSISYGDIADEGDDYTSIPIARNIGSKIYITDVVFNNGISDITIPLVKQKFSKNDVKYARIESNNMGGMYARFLQKEVPNTMVLTASSTSNKHTKILMEAAFILENCYFLHEDYQDDEYKAFMKQLRQYLKVGGAKHDDAPDSMAGLSIFIRAMLAHLYT